MPTERKPRKARADSQESAVKAMVAEKVNIIKPPIDIKLSVDDQRAFDEIIEEFAKVDWTSHTIRLAAMLARSLVLLRQAQDEVISDGFTYSTEKGERMSPTVSAMNMLSGQVMTARRTLALHATGASRTLDVKARQRTNKANADDAPEDDDNLLSVPRAPLSVVK